MTPPPDTDLKTQGKRHIGPLVGIGAVLVFALVALVWWLGSVMESTDEPAVEDNPAEATE